MAKGLKVYFTIGRDAGKGVFADREGASANTRVMSSEVFKKAMKQAEGKFREVASHRDDGGVTDRNVRSKQHIGHTSGSR